MRFVKISPAGRTHIFDSAVDTVVIAAGIYGGGNPVSAENIGDLAHRADFLPCLADTVQNRLTLGIVGIIVASADSQIAVFFDKRTRDHSAHQPLAHQQPLAASQYS